jgi:hypothetical protein
VLERAFLVSDFKQGEDGTYTMRKRVWRYSFIATNEIFELYDTYAIIATIRNETKGFLKKTLQEKERAVEGGQGGDLGDSPNTTLTP